MAGTVEPDVAAGSAAAAGLAAFPRARVLLIGTGRHAPGSGLPDVPAVADTLADLKSAFVECCGLAAGTVRAVADPATAQVMGEAVAEAADQAQGLLLVYYIGHGLVSQDGQLHLAAHQTDGVREDGRVSRLEVTALPYAHLRNLVLDSEARARVVVLDCCFSGRALAGLANAADEVANLAQVAGGFVLTSAGGEEVAFAPVGARHTAFTGALLGLLREGDPHGPQWLTLQQVHRYLAGALPAAGFPRPRQRSDGRVGELVLAANRAYRPPRQRDGRPTSPALDAAVVGVCPYKGLAAFGEADQMWFRGRQALVARLVARLADRLADPRPLVVTGPSGSGKSSLLRAGLLPAVGRGELGVAGSASWPRLVLTPTSDPVTCLAEHLTPFLAAAQQPVTGDGRGPERVAVLVRRHPDQLAKSLREVLPDGGPGGSRLVLVVDQFEEIFALCEDEPDRQAFIRALTTLACDEDGVPAALVVLGVRADFYGRCTSYPELAPALEGQQVVVAAMTAAQTREAIEQPAQVAGLGVQPGLVEMLLADLGADRDNTSDGGANGGDGEPVGAYEPGRLPLLAHALRETWQHRDGNTLTVEAYQRTGGIQGALAATADRVLAGLDQNGREMARRLLLRLVRLGEGSDDTRRRVPRPDLLADTGDPPLASAVLDAFAAARMVTVNDDAVQITHEALLRAWPTLRGWIDDDRAGLLVQQQLIDAAHEWLRHDRDPSTLYTGTRLTLAIEWATPQRRATLPAAAVEFLDTSSVREEQRQQRELAERTAASRRARRDRILAVVLAVLLAGSLTGGGLAVAQWQRADSQQHRAQVEQQRAIAQQRAATARGLTIKAESLRGIDPNTAIRLDLAAVTISPEQQTRASLKTTLAIGRLAGTGTLTGGTGHSISAIALNLDRHTMVTASSGTVNGTIDKTVRLWDISDRNKPQRTSTLTGHTGAVYAVAFSPDGRTLATASDHRTIKLWDISDRNKPQRTSTLTGDAAVYAVAFVADGRTLATASDDKTIRLWDISDRNKPQRTSTLTFYTGYSGAVFAVAFSPDGRTLAISGGDATSMALAFVELLDLSDRSKPQRRDPLTGHTAFVEALAFSPDGRTLYTVSEDDTYRLWDISPGSAITADPVAEACRVVGGSGLTPEMWNRYVPEMDYRHTCPG